MHDCTELCIIAHIINSTYSRGIHEMAVITRNKNTPKAPTPKPKIPARNDDSLVTKDHKAKFEQLLDDAVLGIKKK